MRYLRVNTKICASFKYVNTYKVNDKYTPKILINIYTRVNME